MLRNDNNLTGIRALYPEVPPSLLDLFDSRYEFYLTGSRAWRNSWVNPVGPTSDWDVFVQDSPDLRDYLASLGFREEYQNEYSGDANANAVYYKVDEDVDTTVHVQIQNDAYAKLNAQKLIKTFVHGFYLMDKRQRAGVWHAVQAAVVGEYDS